MATGRPAPSPPPVAGRGPVLTRALVEVARRLKLKSTEVTGIIGVSQPTASRLLNGKFQLAEGTKPWELAAHLVRLYRSLSSMVAGDDELVRAWLRSGNAAFDGRTPLESIQSVEGLVHACDYVDAHRARV